MSGWTDCCRRCRAMCAIGKACGGRARGSDEVSGGPCEMCAACKARMTRCARVAGLLAAAGAAYARAGPAAPLRWGATAAEAAGALPGDELVSGARYRSTRAITIAAPAAAVWPWLVQMGQGKGGFYTYDALENLMRLNIHSADRIVAEWQSAVAGVDKVDLAPDGSVPMALTICDPERAFVIRTGAPGEPAVAPAASSVARSPAAGRSSSRRSTWRRRGSSSAFAPTGGRRPPPGRHATSCSSRCISSWSTDAAWRQEPRGEGGWGRVVGGCPGGGGGRQSADGSGGARPATAPWHQPAQPGE